MSDNERDLRRLLQEVAELRQENRRLREITHNRGQHSGTWREKDKSIQQILEYHIEPAFTCSINGSVLSANETLCRKLGRSKDYIIGSNIAEYVHNEDWQEVKERLDTTDFGDLEVVYEFRLVSSDGRSRWYQFTRAPLAFNPKIGPEILMIGRDVTELKNAHNLALTQRDLSVGLSEASNLKDAISLCVETMLKLSSMDACGVYLFNENSELRLISGKGLSGEWTGSVKSFSSDSLEAAMVKNGEPLYFHEGFSDRSRKLVEDLRLKTVAVAPILHKDQAIGCFIVASNTVSEIPVFIRRAIETIAAQIGAAIIRVRTQEELEKVKAELEGRVKMRSGELKLAQTNLEKEVHERRKAEEEIKRLGEAVEQAEEIIFITDTTGKILYVNPAFERTTGYTAKEALGKTPRILKSGKHPHNFYKNMWDIILQGVPWKGRIVNKRKDGELYEEEATISPIRNQEGLVVNFVAVKRDITNVVALERHLRQAQKMEAIGALAGGIAHDFNNLLQVIVGYTQMAMLELLAGSRAHSRLEQVFKAGVRATELVKQILSFSRQVDREKGPVQLGPITKETCKFLKASTPANIEIVTQIDDDLDLVMADPTQMHQVIMNLGTNSAQAIAPKGGRIQFKLNNVNLEEDSLLKEHGLSQGKHVRLTVKDDGEGIAPHICDRLFEPYFTTKSLGEGTGLGLAVVHGIVKGHHGAIIVNSEVGRGSEFVVYLPSLERSETLVDPPGKPVPRGGERILFIDDEQPIVEIANEMLQDLGYKTITSTDPIEALEIFRQAPEALDLIITDMSMPKMSGLDLTDHALSIRQDIPVIICTGFSSRINEEEAGKIGAKAFLMKPILRNQLAETIRRVLDE